MIHTLFLYLLLFYLFNVLIFFIVNEIFAVYNNEPNFLTYLVDGPQHCFSPMDVFYTADAKGPRDDGQTNTLDMMYDWYDL